MVPSRSQRMATSSLRRLCKATVTGELSGALATGATRGRRSQSSVRSAGPARSMARSAVALLTPAIAATFFPRDEFRRQIEQRVPPPTTRQQPGVRSRADADDELARLRWEHAELK